MSVRQMNRRAALQSATAMIALPFLESFGFRRFAAAAETVAPPKRIAFLGFGWGVTEESFFPDMKTPGADYELPLGLKPLERHKADFSVIQGLRNKYSVEGHAGSTWWLSGANPYAEPGQSYCNTISADQVAATQFGPHTRFSSLQFNHSEGGDRSGHGPGLSLAWDASGKPIGGENGPLQAYHRLFSKDTVPLEQRRLLIEQKRSVLDTVLENARSLQRGLGKNDNQKLDEYFDSIRQIETGLAKGEKWMDRPRPEAPFGAPSATVQGRDEINLMYDLMVAAFQTDSTRVITYRQPVATLLTSIGNKVAPHDMSHYHSTRGEKLACSQLRDRTQTELLAGLIDKLKATRESDGSSLFDNMVLAYGSNIRTGHDLTNCPTLITGGGAGLKLGHNIVVQEDTPLCNAWLTMLQGIGVQADSHGDSTGVVKELRA
ncbi:DUF1552 domain-containing protein [Rubinisphaera brasiliensis]|uniref:Secreted protein containing DUF1552 n=1 Tax=Rubinisphaera brasiliensis (strain ATCC 49424 / DSM 5305 / JCM 21570 / IAM 15109 / NBRC 103401 / IFAM 1448) TaxID=756272 RepID=F0SH57_RUBBR|nr:DUF1552 domain-containing protein [Rubinisphaera brasiliensis]ADY60598.1 protein of unknown function DUF1552 [Rubinisphaera brasiliensis DSM 5305]